MNDEVNFRKNVQKICTVHDNLTFLLHPYL